MEDNLEYIDTLIAKVLSNEASSKEIAELDKWKELSEENSIYYSQSANLFKHINAIEFKHQVDENKAWDKVNNRINGHNTKVVRLFTNPTIFRMAAALVLITVSAVLATYYFKSNSSEVTQIATLNQIKKDTLPDGSVVCLNKNSELNFTISKNNTRQVKLKGEAYFEVIHDETKPFEILVNDVIIKDIGTAFNVKAIPNSDTIEVLVESGEVQFFSSTNKGLNLTKGQKAIYLNSSKAFALMKNYPDQNIGSYQSNIFTFNETPLSTVVKQLNSVYNANISIADDSLKSKKITVLFNNESIDQIISILEETLDIKVTKKDSSIVLKANNTK